MACTEKQLPAPKYHGQDGKNTLELLGYTSVTNATCQKCFKHTTASVSPLGTRRTKTILPLLVFSPNFAPFFYSQGYLGTNKATQATPKGAKEENNVNNCPKKQEYKWVVGC